ncbi:MAG: 2-succinyl-5-enolpyruvyl-6-hydroxy-3-cyclohexene-1-carboxylic-acid synthase [Chloroflexi bacterium]|nr:2-succinyl-5-enolpyruvyl-6-hydroxy-3-cyclohexene-1-carboxylic-acid synthase [Chloroflexota bacterium]
MSDVAAPQAGPPAATLRAFVDGLVRGGVRHAVVCPGSRSTPMALALAADPRIRLLTHIDERAGAFLALGIAKASRAPVVFLATSGTASVNAHPAVVEARYGRVPLLVLTADRPPELRDRSAPQTIDQVHLFGSAARWFVEMPVPEPGAAAEAHWRSVGIRTAATATGAPEGRPAGPVHVNLPFREPLVPVGDLGTGAEEPAAAQAMDPAADPAAAPAAAPAADPARAPRSTADVERPARLAPSDAAVPDLAAALASAHRPLLLCGPADDPALPAALAALAAAVDAPVVADPLSGLRHGAHDRSRVLSRGDLVVRGGPWLDAHGPDLVVRFGGVPTSKPIALMLDAVRPALWIVDAGDAWPEPGPCPAMVVRADPAVTAAAVAAGLVDASAAPSAAVLAPAASPPRPRPSAVEAGWCAAWLAADAAASDAAAAALGAIDEPFEGRVFDALGDALPPGALLWLGSSMPIRDADAYLTGGPSALRVLANRGANGIDGVVSSAIGAAAAHDGPVVAVVGDLSFLHDLNALVGARLNALGLTVIVVDNDGGGIFSFLPQATADAPGAGLPERFERLFGVAHGTGPRLGDIVRALGGRWMDVAAAGGRDGAAADRAALVSAVREATAREGVTVIRYATERTRNVELHRLIAARVRDALGPREAGR